MFDYDPEAIRTNLKTLIVGRRIEFHKTVDSTNDLAKDAARHSESEGLVVLAEEQTKGRGRLGRIWTAPPGSSVLCSILLRPRFSPMQAFYLTIAAALAIHRTVGQQMIDHSRKHSAGSSTSPNTGNPHSAIKWPNDVLVNGRKVSGVLSEGEFMGGEWSFAVVGFGVNVNLNARELEELRAIAPEATSLSAEWGMEVDRAVLLAWLLAEFEGLYLALQNGQFGPVFEEWAGALETVGRHVTMDYGGRTISGQALRVESDGSLVIRTMGGVERNVLSGDIV